MISQERVAERAELEAELRQSIQNQKRLEAELMKVQAERQRSDDGGSNVHYKCLMCGCLVCSLSLPLCMSLSLYYLTLYYLMLIL